MSAARAVSARTFAPSDLIITGGRARVRAGVAPTVEQGVRNAQAGGSTPLTSSTYRSKLEAAYAQRLDLELAAKAIKGYWYEPFSFRLSSGKRYRVDFLVWTEAGLECVEVKGHHPNLRDSLTHLKWAAQKFPCFVWRRVWKQGHGFDGMYVVV